MGSMDLVKPTVEKICNGLHFGRVVYLLFEFIRTFLVYEAW